MRHGPRLCHGLASARRARSAVREPNYGPEGEIEWELRPWIAGLTEVSARTPPVLSDTTQDSLVPPLSSPTQRHSINGMARGAYEISPDMAPGADEPSLPALPKVSPDRWRQEYTGCSTVLAITLTDLVLVHANGWADAAANGAFTQLHGALMLAVDGLAVLAMLMLAGVMCGGRDLVVRRTPKTVTPLPPAVRELLIAGESLDGLANLVDGDDSYCVRCCVWRRPPPPPTPICCGGSGGGRGCHPLQPSNRAHHCRYCGECVLGFDHHCGFFGRCITGSLLYGGGNMRAFIGIIRCTRTRTRTCTCAWCMGGLRMCMASAWCTMHIHAYRITSQRRLRSGRGGGPLLRAPPPLRRAWPLPTGGALGSP